jgi:hypothetical protein
MQADPIAEWQRLTDHYRQISNEELRELAWDFGDLTEQAQQALRAEMQSRGLSDPQAPPTAPPSNVPAAVRIEEESNPESPALPLGHFFGSMPQIVPDVPDTDADDDGAHDYTWKTVLCDCDTNEQAQELSAALHQAGLDSWVQPSVEFGRSYARVLVAADQLEQARAIAAQPVPKQTAAESKEDVPEFEPPKCPKCGTEDPVLEAVDPTNTWLCEQCGEQWSDSDEPLDQTTSTAGLNLPQNGKSRPATGQLSPQGE